MEEVHLENKAYLKKLVCSGVIAEIPSEHISVQFFKKGGGNFLYIIDAGNKKFLARVNYYHLKNEWKVKEHEFKILKMLEPLGIAPKAYYLDDSEKGLKQHLIITDFVDGEPIGTVATKQVIALAKTLKKLHTQITFEAAGNSIPPTDPLPYSFGVYDEFANGEDKQIEKYADWPGMEKVTGEFNRIKSSLSDYVKNSKCFDGCRQFSLCHADLKLENILATKDGVCLIDWECAGSDVPETDIGRLFAGAQFTEEFEQLFLANYYEVEPEQILLDRIYLTRMVLDFFRIMEDYILLKRKLWDANKMALVLQAYENKHFGINNI